MDIRKVNNKLNLINKTLMSTCTQISINWINLIIRHITQVITILISINSIQILVVIIQILVTIQIPIIIIII